MHVKKYLSRIGIEKTDFRVEAETIKFLQKQHLLQIPFENLDIHWKRRIILDKDKFFQKIVEEKRGGFCYELNGLFFELLREIGFRSRIISARVSSGNGKFGAEYDHLAIITETEGAEFLVDVGFGNFTAEPLKFVLDIEQRDQNGLFLIKKFDEEYFEVLKKDQESWKSEYIFAEMARDLSEFAGMCSFHQTSPESHFTRGKVCSLMLENGRKTLTDRKFIETTKGLKKETEVASDKQFREILEREFGVRQIL